MNFLRAMPIQTNRNKIMYSATLQVVEDVIKCDEIRITTKVKSNDVER